MAWLVTSLRRLRDGVSASVGLAIVVLVTAGVFAAVPRVNEMVATGLLRTEVASTREESHNIVLVQQRRIPGGAADPLAAVQQTGDDLQAQIPSAVRGLLADRIAIVDTPRLTVVASPASYETFRLRVQQDVDAHLRLVDGSMPSAAQATADAGQGAADPTAQVPLFEVAISSKTADAFGLKVGDTVRLVPDPSDPKAARVRARVAARIVGIVDVTDLSAPYWGDDAAVDRPLPRYLNVNVTIEDGTALIAPDAYPALLAAAGDTSGGQLALRYMWRFPLDPARLHASDLDAILTALQRMESVFPASDAAAAGGGTQDRSALLPLVQGFASRWRAAEVVLTVVVIGSGAVALLGLGLVTVLAARRRRRSLALARERGGSTLQLASSLAGEGLVVALPAAAIGAALAMALVPDGPAALTAAAAVAVAALCAIVLVVAAMPPSSGPPRDPTRDVGTFRRAGARRLVAEGAVIVAALAGAFLLRERGVRGTSAAGGLLAPDPFIAAVPALVGIAAGLIAMRLYPIPMRLFAVAAARRRDLVPVHALRRITRGSASAGLLVVLMATATIGAFATATLGHLDRATEAAAWRDVGAAFRVTAVADSAQGQKAGVTIPLPAGFDPSALPQVEASAEAARANTSFFPRGASLDLLALDVARYAKVTQGTPVQPDLPPDLLDTSGATPLPAVVSTALATGPERLVPGATFQLIVAGAPRTLRVVEVRDAFPTLGGSDRWAVVSLDGLRVGTSASEIHVTDAYLRAPDAATDAIGTAAVAASPDIAVASRAEETAALRAAPVVGSVSLGVTLATLVAALYAALAVAAALILAGASRATEVAHLRTLGLTGRQSAWLTIGEHGPAVAVALVVGAALGFGLFAALRSGLGLGAVIGSDVDVPLTVDPARLAAVVALSLGAMAVGVTVATVVAWRTAPAEAIRRRME